MRVIVLDHVWIMEWYGVFNEIIRTYRLKKFRE